MKRSAGGSKLGEVLLLCLVVGVHSVDARESPDEVGKPFIRSFASGEDYEAHAQNWAVVQDPRGVMYFGNTDGVLEYDGHSFRLIPLANGSIARSLAVAEDGTVYVGGVGELGFLGRTDSGELQFESLLEHVPEARRGFADVWRTLAYHGGAVFSVGQHMLLRWDGEQLHVLQVDFITWPFLVQDELWLVNPERGLVRIAGDDLLPVKGGEALAQTGVFAIEELEENIVLIGTGREGLYLLHLDNGRFERFPTEVDEALRRFQLYSALLLDDGSMVLGTASGGAFYLDGRGRLVQRLDKQAGIPDNSVWQLARDAQGGVWMALNRGLSRVDVTSPVTVFGEAQGIDGTVEAVARHESLLYAATSTGVKVLREREFQPVGENGILCWSLLCFEDPELPDSSRLLVGTNTGVDEVEGDKRTTVWSGQSSDSGVTLVRNVYQLAQSTRDPHLLFVGFQEGLCVFRLAGGRWRNEGRIEQVTAEVRSIVEAADGWVWLGTHYKGVFRLRIDAQGEAREVSRYGLEDGLPTLTSVKAVEMGDEVVFATSAGFYSFDDEDARFRPDQRLPAEHDGAPVGVLRAVVDDDGDIWISMVDQQRAAVIHRDQGEMSRLETKPFRQMPEMGVYALLPEADGVTWIGGTRGLFRFDSKRLGGVDRPGATLVRRVATGKGEVLFGGAGDGPSFALGRALQYEENSLRFEFSTPQFEGPRGNEFSTLLEGYDREWSRWTSETRRDFTNLDEGTYRFRVRSRDLFGAEGTEASYAFRIMPPWYRTLWAYGFYAALLAGAMVGFARVRSLRLQRDKERLEELVHERTTQLRAYTQRLEQTQQELESFTYSVSHDVRAPLRRIGSFAQILIEEHAGQLDDTARHYLDRLSANAERMTRLVNDLLALSRVTRAELTRCSLDLGAMATEICTELAAAEPDRQIEVAVEPGMSAEGDPVLVRFVLENLLANAWKFTRGVDRPRIEVGSHRTGDGDLREYFVRDNGVGFDISRASDIFTPFRRFHSEEEFEGTGVGLATVRRSVHRHGGKVRAEAAVGAGAAFYFTLEPEHGRETDLH